MHNQYLQHLRDSGLRPKTVKVAESALKHWATMPDCDPLEKAGTFRQMLAHRPDWSTGYKNNLLERVRAMHNWARTRDKTTLTTEQIVNILAPFPKDRERPRVLTRKELKALAYACKQAGTPTANTALCCLLTGARHREILTLTPDRVSTTGVEIIAAHSKNRQGRVIPGSILSRRTLVMLRKPHKWNRVHWETIRKAAGLEGLPVKALRSTAATYFVNRGLLTPFQCAEIMGHTVDVAQRSYWSGVILGLTGDTTAEWLGIHGEI